jgi:hypothetical protein
MHLSNNKKRTSNRTPYGIPLRRPLNHTNHRQGKHSSQLTSASQALNHQHQRSGGLLDRVKQPVKHPSIPETKQQSAGRLPQ